jgi:hypothetical protein
MEHHVLKASPRKLGDRAKGGCVELHVSDYGQRRKAAEQCGRGIDAHGPVRSRIKDDDGHGLDPDYFLEALPGIGDIELVFGHENVPNVRQLVRGQVDGDAHEMTVITRAMWRLDVTNARVLL